MPKGKGGYSPGQKKIARVAPPRNKITGADFAKLRKNGKKKGVSLSLGRGEKSRKGGLTAKGRAKYNRATGSNLKAPQPGGGARKRSFCARMSGMKGPLKKPNGKPTRKALALRQMEMLMAITYNEHRGR